MAGNRRKSLNNKNKIVCSQCKTEVLTNEDALQCDVCNKTLHSICTKKDKKQIEKLLNNASLEFTCHFCQPSESANVVNELTEIKSKLNQLDDIRESIKFMSSQYDTILKGVANNNKKINNLQKENKSLRNEVKQLKSSVKFLNDVRVQNDCVINGVKVKDEKVKAIDIVLNIAQKTGADICENEIDDAYFLNTKEKSSNVSTEPRMKSIVVKFANKKCKKIFMAEKAKMKDMDDFKKVYVNDFMCKESMEVFNYAKSLKEVGYSFVYTRGGIIFARKDSNSRPFRIKSMDDVDRILLNSSGGGGRRNGSVVHVETTDDDSDDDGDGNVDEVDI